MALKPTGRLARLRLSRLRLSRLRLALHRTRPLATAAAAVPLAALLVATVTAAPSHGAPAAAAAEQAGTDAEIDYTRGGLESSGATLDILGYPDPLTTGALSGGVDLAQLPGEQAATTANLALQPAEDARGASGAVAAAIRPGIKTGYAYDASADAIIFDPGLEFQVDKVPGMKEDGNPVFLHTGPLEFHPKDRAEASFPPVDRTYSLWQSVPVWESVGGVTAAEPIGTLSAFELTVVEAGPGSSEPLAAAESFAVPEAGDPTEVTGTFGEKLTIPTHRSPAGGQTTHPSVVRVPGGWNGYEYWMAHTPYPGSDDSHEDPNVVASKNGIDWVKPKGLANPLDDQPGLPGPHNSDTDLRMGPSNTMYVFWRTVFPDLRQERLYYSTSKNGSSWSAKKEVMRNSMDKRRLLSPSFLYENGRWVMWAIDMKPSPNRMVYLKGGSKPESSWSKPTTVDSGTMQSGKEPWHVSVVKDGRSYIGLLNDTVRDRTGVEGDLLFISGRNPLSFENSGRSVIPRVKPGKHDHLYRATLLAGSEDGEEGYRVWYSARWAGNPDVWNVNYTFLRSATVQ